MSDPSRWIGPAVAVPGLALLGASVTVLAGTGWPQLAAVLAGLAASYLGLDRTGRALFGPGFDLMFWLCGLWLVVLVGAAILAPLLPLGEHQDIVATLGSPGMAVPDLSTAHPLGTNNFGLDLLARLVYGARSSLVVSLGAVLIGMIVGGAVGIAAGYLRRADAPVGVLTNSLLAVPPLILLIALGTVLDPTLTNIAIALSLLAVPSMIRMARANTLAFTQREFVLAAEMQGASRWRIATRELLPNVVPPLASYGMVMVSVLIVAEASLSFLGLGVQPPAPSWGNMIAEGEQNNAFTDHPHIVLVPGVTLFLTVFAFNLVGEKARKRWDPRQAKL
ncbi:ABC transporter permease [Actinomadura algeriensis]|uniref:Peptide/nickel transport system permease protein n=1 Tax=Actinomadura algeriensis TaxID=1679523 RepID=A0ABR9JL39_9ACTN|nr:ABC transporter permease [Actinomadura algeriensis]MBE1530835.1 peptide/nickel transport system permease protein [Actinomadura algeriensis]